MAIPSELQAIWALIIILRVLSNNRHGLCPKQCGRDGKGLLPRLLEIVGSVRMKKQERLRKGDATSHLLSQILTLAGTAPRGCAQEGVWHCGVSQLSVWLFSLKDTLAGILK